MTLILGFLFLLLEISLFRGLLGRFGFQPIVLATLATGVVGYLILRFQGRIAQARVQQMLQKGADPAALMEGILARSIGGLLLIIPGFLTDLLGVTFLLPLTRPLWRRLLRQRLGAGAAGAANPFVFPGGAGGPGHRPVSSDEKVVDADYEVIE